MSVPAVRLKIRVKLSNGSRPYLNPFFAANGKLKSHYALVGGKPQHHPEGVYHLRYVKCGKRVWEPVGNDPQLAMTAKLRVEHSLQGVSLGLTPADPVRSAQSGVTDLDEAIRLYLEDTAQLKSRKTLHAYSLTLKGFRSACPLPKHIEKVTRRDILGYMEQLRMAGNVPRTVVNRVDFLKIFFNRYHIAWPMEKTDKVKYTEKEVSAYNNVEIAKLLQHADQEETELILFLLQTGAREQEVQFADWSDVDFNAKTFMVREKLDIKFTPKDREEGSIPIPDSLVDALAARRKRNPVGRLIFPAPNGETQGHYLRIVKALALRAGLNCGHCRNKAGQSCATRPVCRGFILHKFRKTFATMHHESGVPVRTIQRWLRHSSLDTTLRYLAASENQSEKTRERVNSTFASLTAIAK